MVAPEVVPATFAALRRCGGGERECVVYWIGPSEKPGAPVPAAVDTIRSGVILRMRLSPVSST